VAETRTPLVAVLGLTIRSKTTLGGKEER
jgi:hypothetical protein